MKLRYLIFLIWSSLLSIQGCAKDPHPFHMMQTKRSAQLASDAAVDAEQCFVQFQQNATLLAELQARTMRAAENSEETAKACRKR